MTEYVYKMILRPPDPGSGEEERRSECLISEKCDT